MKAARCCDGTGVDLWSRACVDLQTPPHTLHDCSVLNPPGCVLKLKLKDTQHGTMRNGIWKAKPDSMDAAVCIHGGIGFALE